MSENNHRHERNLIDRHFEGAATPTTESAMRAHLDRCAGCRDYYDRCALLGQLDPRAVSAEERLAVGLGFGRRLPLLETRAAMAAARVQRRRT